MNVEHRAILDAMNAIFDAHNAGRRGEAVNRMVVTLGKVCVQHFSDEEDYMARIGYAGLNTHKLIHEKLLDDLRAHARAIRCAGGTANEEFFHFLRRWLVAHIKGIDTKYAKAAA